MHFIYGYSIMHFMLRYSMELNALYITIFPWNKMHFIHLDIPCVELNALYFKIFHGL